MIKNQEECNGRDLWHVSQTCELHSLCLHYTWYSKQPLFPYVTASRNAEFYCEVRIVFYIFVRVSYLREWNRLFVLIISYCIQIITISSSSLLSILKISVLTLINKVRAVMSICRPVFTDMLWRMFLELGTNNILPFSWRVLIDLSKPPINQSVLNILHIIFDTVFICRMYILLLNCQTYCKCNRIFVSSNHTYKMRFHEKCIQYR